jgi:hypothetical protein
MPHHELAPTQTVFHDPRRIEWVITFRHMLQNKHLGAIANTGYGIAIAELKRAETDIAAVFRPVFQETLLPIVPTPLPQLFSPFRPGWQTHCASDPLHKMLHHSHPGLRDVSVLKSARPRPERSATRRD